MPDARKTALVILGAGASHDVVPTLGGDPNRFSAPVVHDLRPVLAEHIFTDSRPVRLALEAYADVRELSNDLRDLETGLEETLLQLSRSTMPLKQRGIKEMRLYLRHLFTSISTFTEDPINYAKLVHRLFDNSAFDQVTFVSLNYDRLLDRILEHRDFGGPFASMEAYDRPDYNPHFLYVKLHGSIDWAWRLPGFDPARVREIAVRTSDQDTVNIYRDLIHGTTEWPANLGDPVIADPQDLSDGDALLYPALAIPTGEYDFICPKAHAKKLREFLPTCSNVLVIGCSARDQRLLRLLKAHLDIVPNFVLVDSRGPATTEIKERLLKHVPQLGLTGKIQTYDAGFSKFLRRGGLDKFIGAAR